MTFHNAIRYMSQPTADSVTPGLFQKLCECLHVSFQNGLAIQYSDTRLGRLAATLDFSILSGSDNRVGLLNIRAGADLMSYVQVDGRPLSPDQFSEAAAAVAAGARELSVNPGTLTAPELWTALALWVFARFHCRYYLLVRTGAAGQDPVCQSHAPVVFIGGTLERPMLDTASNHRDMWAGLSEDTVDVITCSLHTTVQNRIVEYCSRNRIRQVTPSKTDLIIERQSLRQTEFQYKEKSGYRIDGGAEVFLNAALSAIEVILALRRGGIILHTDSIRQGLSSYHSEFVMQALSVEPDIILDAITDPTEIALTVADLLHIRSLDGTFWIGTSARYLKAVMSAVRRLPTGCQPGVIACIGESDLPDDKNEETGNLELPSGNRVCYPSETDMMKDFTSRCHPEDLFLYISDFRDVQKVYSYLWTLLDGH